MYTPTLTGVASWNISDSSDLESLTGGVLFHGESCVTLGKSNAFESCSLIVLTLFG